MTQNNELKYYLFKYLEIFEISTLNTTLNFYSFTLFKMIFWENVKSNEFDGLSNFKNISYLVMKNSQ